MSPERIAQVESAIAAQEATGQAWTNLSIYRVGGGKYSTLAAYLKSRRATMAEATGRQGAAPLSAAEVLAGMAEQEPTSLEEELKANELAEQYAEARLSTLEDKATREMLSEAEEVEMVRLERRLGNLANVITRLQREIEQQKETLDVEAFVQAWQPTVDAKRQRYQEFFEAVAHVFQTFQAIQVQHDAQMEGLMQLPPKLQKYMLDTFLPDRATIGARLVGNMVNPGAWQGILLGLGALQVPLPQDLMKDDPGTRALPPRLMQNAINASQPVDRSA